MSVTYIPDHVEQALHNRLSQFSQSPNLELLIRLFVEPLQELEDIAFALITERMLSSAQGAQLDQYGAIAGQRRDGLNDETYRRFISVRLEANRSNGQPDVITTVLATLMSTTSTVQYHPLPPAAFGLSYMLGEYSSDSIRTRVLNLVNAIIPAGVKLEEVVESLPGYWGFEGDDDALPLGTGAFTAEVINA